MRWMWAALLLVAAVGAGCSIGKKESARLPQVSTDCGAPTCVAAIPAVDGEGAPIRGATILIPFDAPIKLGPSQEVAVVNAVLNMETRQPELAFAQVKAMRVDPKTPKLLEMEVDSFLATGAAIAFAQGVLLARNGTPLAPLEVYLTSPWSPLSVALANLVWEPTDRSIFGKDGIQPARGATGEASVRQELNARLRVRGIFSEEQIAGVLT